MTRAQYRLKFLDYDARREPKTNHSCVMCQKDIKPGSPFRMVYIVGVSGTQVLHPDDVASYKGETQRFPLGMGCARKLGLEWTAKGAL